MVAEFTTLEAVSKFVHEARVRYDFSRIFDTFDIKMDIKIDVRIKNGKKESVKSKYLFQESMKMRKHMASKGHKNIL